MSSLISFELNERFLLFTKKEIKLSTVGLLVQNQEFLKELFGSGFVLDLKI